MAFAIEALTTEGSIGQPTVKSTLNFSVETDEPLIDFNVDGATPVVLEQSSTKLRVAFSTKKAVVIQWQERRPALLIKSESVDLADEHQGNEVRVVLTDAKAWQDQFDSITVLVDSSFSMRRRAEAVQQLLARIKSRAKMPVRVIAVNERGEHYDNVGRFISDLRSGALAHFVTWKHFEAAIKKLSCSGRARCIAVTDPQLPGLKNSKSSEIPLVLLADAHELAHFESDLPNSALNFQPGVDAKSKLNAIADELVLPVLNIVSITQEGEPLSIVGHQKRRVAEGGMLRIFARASSSTPLEITAAIGDKEIVRVVQPSKVAPSSERGKAIRRGVYVNVLAKMLTNYKELPSDELKKSIIDLGIAEEIPTPFTALQVDDPELKGFETVMSIDCQGTFNMSHAAYPLLSASGDAIVINISATLQYGATWWQAHASAAKAAVDSLTRSLALEWGSDQIRVVGIAPGPIANTPGMSKLAPGLDASDISDMIMAGIPLGRMGETEEIGQAAVYLCTAKFVTGDTLVVDGGEWLYRPPSVPKDLVAQLSRQVEGKSRAQAPAPRSRL
jgi:NAD(P)-dependent dehydrogenase (short-subunit alcohol dehydrogenase family)